MVYHSEYTPTTIPFNSREFKAFSANYEFEHVTSSPRYPQSNGRVENAVKIVKRLMTKAIDDKRDPYLALLEWRNTPSEQLKLSPVQVMYGRRTRSTLPTTDVLLRPENAILASQRLSSSKERQKQYYDRGSKERPPMAIGQTVRFKTDPNSGQWRKGEITETLPYRSYNIFTDDGSNWRRTSRHVRLSHESPIVLDSTPTDVENNDVTDTALPPSDAPPSAVSARRTTRSATQRPTSTTPPLPHYITKSGRAVIQSARYRD